MDKQKYCTECGKNIEVGDTFCRKCGKPHDESFIKTHIQSPVSESERYSTQVSESSKKKKSTWLKPFIITIVIGLSMIWALFSDDIKLGYYYYSATPEIQRITLNSGLTLKGKVAFLESYPELVGPDAIKSACKWEDNTIIEFGCYVSQSDKIYILRTPSSEYQEVEYNTAAHELLHAVWAKLSVESRTKLYQQLKTIYYNESGAEYSSLHEELQPYKIDEPSIINEVHSFLGSSHTTELNEYYSLYISDRLTSSNAQKQFEQDIETKIGVLNSQKQQLETESSEIDQFKNRYVDSFINRYGTVDAYQYNNYLHNFEMLKEKNSSWEQRRTQFNSEVDKFNMVLKGFYPTDAPIQSL